MRHLEAVADVEIPAPEIDEWLLPIWRCWNVLHLDRPYWAGGMGAPIPGRIPWRDLRAWAEAQDMSDEDFDLLYHCVRAMDVVFLDDAMAKARAAAQAPPPPGRTRGGVILP